MRGGRTGNGLIIETMCKSGVKVLSSTVVAPVGLAKVCGAPGGTMTPRRCPVVEPSSRIRIRTGPS
jgi:hypothetical protein